MAIKADFHLHSSYSGDSQAPMEEMIRKGISLGLSQMCFTEHMDFDFPVSTDTPAGFFEVNTDSYLYDLLKYKAEYRKEIQVSFGIELGLQAYLTGLQSAYTNAFDFDFIIGSSHLCKGRDPYDALFYEGRTEEEAYREYFSSIIENLEAFHDFDIYGHLDYVVRYGPGKDKNYTYEKYQDLFERILDLLLENGIGMEINTGGLRYGLKELHPCRKVLERYREKGGETVTVGYLPGIRPGGNTAERLRIFLLHGVQQKDPFVHKAIAYLRLPARQSVWQASVCPPANGSYPVFVK